MFNLLTDLILSNARGETSTGHQQRRPAHSIAQTWKYNCPCGYVWKFVADAVWKAGAWRAPTQECLNCHDWVNGSRVEP